MVDQSSVIIEDETVSIYVGPKRKKFLVHKKLICEISDFFSKAFTGGFQEAQENSMHLPEDDPNAFALFIDWIYRSKVPAMHNREDQVTLYNLYIFAEKLCLDDLANATMDQIQKLLGILDPSFDQSTALIRKVYTETSSQSPLRKFCAHFMSVELYLEDERSSVMFSKEILRKAWLVFKDNADLFEDFWSHTQKILTQKILDKGAPPDPSLPEDFEYYKRCDFHKHRDGESCT
jgi:hypothetical protein